MEEEITTYEFYREKEGVDFWVVIPVPYRKTGDMLFSFDKKKIYSHLRDYPQNLTKEQRELYDSLFPDDDTPWDI